MEGAEDESMEGMDPNEMDMSSSSRPRHCGRFPTVASRSVSEGLEEAESPTYEVDSIAIIEDDHRRCEGCRSNYSSCIRHYSIYCFVHSNNWGKRVENHKWVIHDDI